MSGPTQSTQSSFPSQSSETTLTIGGVKVVFPMKPYPSQMAMMNKVIQGLKHRQNCLLESPTGSGKSLALLCASLAWQRHETDRVNKYNEEINIRLFKAAEAERNVIREKLKAKKLLTDLQNVQKPAPTVEPAKVKTEKLPGGEDNPICIDGPDCSIMTSTDDSISFEAAQIMTDDDDDDDFDPRKCIKPPFKTTLLDNIPSSIPNKKTELPEKVVLPDEKQMEVDHVPGSDPSEQKLKVPKIYFGTRTHKQIAQITRELRKTIYKRSRSVILAGREHACIHPFVSKNSNKNDECKALLDQSTFGGEGCSFHLQAKKMNFETLNNYGLSHGYDLEEFVSVGKKARACPYFAARSLMTSAQIIFCPYNYLIDPSIRDSMGIDLDNQIVIFDEAHNMEDASREATSFIVSHEDVKTALQDFEKVASKHDFTGNREAYGSLAQFLSSFMGWMSSHEDSLQVLGFDSSGKHWTGTEAFATLEIAGFTKDYVTKNKNYFQSIRDDQKEAADMQKERGRRSSTDVPQLVALTVVTTGNIFRVFEYLSGERGVQRDDFRVALLKNTVIRKNDMNRRTSFGSTSKQELSVNIWCLNPAVAFNAIHSVVHSIVLTSGTLSPMQSFQSELGSPFPIKLEAAHVIDRNQIFAGVLTVGPHNISLNGSYKNVETIDYQDELGRVVFEVCREMPKGVLCFFPSYRLLQKVADRWRTSGMWAKISEIKDIYEEPRTGVHDFEEAISYYYRSNQYPLEEKTGGLFLAVCRGKVSEGLDFADDNARAVICVGIPFPNFKDLQVELKREYNNKNARSRGILLGSEWYEIQAFRALNQALGRCIRHRHDWGAILLVDDRFAQSPRYIQSLSKWVRSSIQTYKSYGMMLRNFVHFREEMSARPKPDASYGIYGISDSSSFDESPAGGGVGSITSFSTSGGENSDESFLRENHAGGPYASNNDNFFSINGSSNVSTPRSSNMDMKGVKNPRAEGTSPITQYFKPSNKRRKNDTEGF